MTEADLKALVAIAERAAVQYVTNPKTDEVIGAISWHKGYFIVSAVLDHDGDWRDRDTNHIACRAFRSLKKAEARAANILNADEPVNIAAIL